MKIGVIGTINKDSIYLSDRSFQNGWGGILYNLVAFSNLARKNEGIVPICNVGRDCHRNIMSIIDQLKSTITYKSTNKRLPSAFRTGILLNTRYRRSSWS